MSQNLPVVLQSLDEAIAAYIRDRRPDIDMGSFENQSFASMGLNSVDMAQVTAIAEDKLNIEVDPSVPFDYPTYSSLRAYLEASLKQTGG